MVDFKGFLMLMLPITYSIKNSYPELTISVINKLLIDVLDLKKIFKGNIYYDKGQNGYYKWSIQERSDINFFKDYLLKYPSRSNKKQRLFLTDQYFLLKNQKAYSALPNSPLNKAWLTFNNKWNNRG